LRLVSVRLRAAEATTAVVVEHLESSEGVDAAYAVVS